MKAKKQQKNGTWVFIPGGRAPDDASARLGITDQAPPDVVSFALFIRDILGESPCGNLHELSLDWDAGNWLVVRSRTKGILAGMKNVPEPEGGLARLKLAKVLSSLERRRGR